MKNLLFLALSLAVPDLAQAEPVESILSPKTHPAMKQYLQKTKRFPSKNRKQDNFYIDTQDLLLRHNGISVRVRLVHNDEAKISIETVGRYKSKVFKLEEPETATDSAPRAPDEAAETPKERREYVCKFSRLKQAERILQENNLTFLFKEAESICPVTDKSFNGINPITFLLGALSELKSGQESDPEGLKDAQIKAEDLKIVATNTEQRTLFNVTIAGFDIKLRLDETVLSNGDKRYAAELDTDDVPEASMEAMVRGFESFLKSSGLVELRKPVAGKILVSMLVAFSQQEELKKLYQSQEIYPAQ